MKILVDLLQSTGTKGGQESYIRGLYTEFGSIKTGHEFIGLVPAETRSFDSFDWFPGELHKSRHSGEDRVSWAIGEAFGVGRFAEKVGADLIHAPAMLGPVNSKVPVALTIHDLSYFTHPQLMRNRALTPGVKLLEKLASRNAKTIIASSEATAREIPKYLGAEVAKKVTTVLLAGTPVQPCNNRTLKRATKPTFIAMGQRSPYKSLETLVHAMRLIPKENRPRLIMTGSHGRDPLTPLVARLELQEDIELLSWIEDVELRELMCTSWGLVETTVAAGFGMPAVEAMSMGIPVISSDIPVFREILDDAALFYEAGNPSALAAVLNRAISRPEELEALSTLGPARASRYSWSRTARETLDVFESALS